MALSGSFRINSNVSYLWLQVNWSATQNVAGNYSDIKTDVYIQKSGSASPWNATNNTLLINIDGNRSERATTFDLRNKNSQLIGSHSARLSHNASGDKTFSIGVNFPTGISAGTINNTVSFSLNKIPRAYTFITNTNSYTFDSAMTVFINANGSGFRADLEMLFGNKLVTLQTNCPIGTNFFPIPKGSDFASQISNNVSGVGLLRVVTYNGSTKVGTAEKTNIKFTLPNTNAYTPTISSISVTDKNSNVTSVMGSNTLYVQGMSRPTYTINTTIAYGSEIKDYKLTVGGLTFTSKTSVIEVDLASVNIGTGNVTATATVTDNRGRTNSSNATINIQSYSPPNIGNFGVTRLSDPATTIQLTKSISTSSLKNGSTEKNSYTVVTKYKKGSASAWTTVKTETNSSANLTLTGFAVDSSYDFLVTVTDKFSSVDVQGSVSTNEVLMDLYKDVGVGIGKMYEEGHGALDVGDMIYMMGKSLLNTFYPVGTIYQSTNPANPSTFMGGTWERYAKGQVLVGLDESDTDFSTPGKTGGEKAHKLTATELPRLGGSQLFHGAGTIGTNLSSATGIITSGDKIENKYHTNATSTGASSYNSFNINFGGDQAHNNLQPYATVYTFRRIA